ncbi:MAG: hypothetical protein ACRYGA_00645 [Janthinobacterium lividum]
MADASTDTHAGFGLSDTNVRALRAVIAAHRKVLRADIYGSHAMGRFRPGSDIDLTLRGDLLTATDLLAVDREIDDPALRDHIDRVWRPLYEAEPSR